ncbi:MAG: hypothetical protein FWE98_08370 [Oscillospiraceae bacterium]|nr:hypothetical protein [Oscillospiraceae bacterium]
MNTLLLAGLAAVGAVVLFVLGAWTVTGISYVLGAIGLLLNIPTLITTLVDFFSDLIAVLVNMLVQLL